MESPVKLLFAALGLASGLLVAGPSAAFAASQPSDTAPKTICIGGGTIPPGWVITSRGLNSMCSSGSTLPTPFQIDGIPINVPTRGEMREAVTRGKVASYVAYILYKYSLFSSFPSCLERHFAVE